MHLLDLRPVVRHKRDVGEIYVRHLSMLVIKGHFHKNPFSAKNAPDSIKAL
jgi:hypothetical protein